jgi:hypothetical protein
MGQNIPYCYVTLNPLFFWGGGVTSPLCTAHNVQLVKVYSVVNTTNYSFIVSTYSIDDKLHVSAIWWPSSGFEQVSEERACYFTFPLVLRSQTVLVA